MKTGLTFDGEVSFEAASEYEIPREVIAYGYGRRDPFGTCEILIHRGCAGARLGRLVSVYREGEAVLGGTCFLCKRPIDQK